MTRRVAKYLRASMLKPRFSVDERPYRRNWWLPRRQWRSLATFDTLDQAVSYLRELESGEQQRRDAEIGDTLQVLFESDGDTWVKQ